MKIALIHLLRESGGYHLPSDSEQVPTLGLGYLASFLENHGFHADLFDLRCLEDDEESLLKHYALDSYDILGFSVHSRAPRQAGRSGGNPRGRWREDAEIHERLPCWTGYAAWSW